MDHVVTEAGTKLPLLNLKGKSYLMCAYRLQWLSEKYAKYTIDTEFLLLNDDQAIAKSTITLYDENNVIIRRASATKRETKKDFPDFLEKAETSSCGRALSMLGLGTQHALSDLDEGTRLADSPLESVQKAKTTDVHVEVKTEEKKEEPKKASSFRKPKAEKIVTPEEEDEWS